VNESVFEEHASTATPHQRVHPGIATRAYRVPSGTDWVHEIKHNG
jgi:hypothetical protein